MNLHSLLVGMGANGAATLEGSLTISYKTKHILDYNSAIALFGIYPKVLKVLCAYKTLHEDVYSSFLLNC